MTAVLELSGIPHGSDQRGCRFGTDPFHPGDALTGFTLLKDACDCMIKVRDAQIEFLQELIEIH